MAEKPAIPDASAFEGLGTLYLGKKVDAATGETHDDLVLYDADDLTTHAVCVGMTGSGKTGLCVCLLEEALLDGIPALIIDPKGDMGNLLLTFPELKAEQFLPWIDPSEASRKGKTVAELAADTAELWRNGLASWGQSGERIRRLKQSADMTIYTPGASSGVGLSVLKSFSVPSAAVLEDSEALSDRIGGAVDGILTLLGIDADPLQSREHILLSSIFNHAWSNSQSLGLADLIQRVQKPGFQRVGVLDLESFYPEKDRFKLAMQLNNLIASPSFSTWLEGASLDIRSLLWTPEGKPRLAIVSIAHLNEQERMFIVTLLLNEMISWMRAQPGTGSLRALLYMDEVFGYFPPTANPPSKKPMLTLLKQARAYGLGVVLSTQNPVDLDYKGLSNAGTWLLGRLQTDRDKQRVLDGLESASAAAGAAPDRSELDKLLSGLGKRTFLLHNTHEREPVLLKTRWAMSYLRGPLTRNQIRELMDGREQTQQTDQAATSSPTISAGATTGRPALPPGLEETFAAPVARLLPDMEITYIPGLIWEERIHFADGRRGIDHWIEQQKISLIEPGTDLRSTSRSADMLLTESAPLDGAVWSALPDSVHTEKDLKSLMKECEAAIYREERLRLFRCKSVNAESQPGETEGDFRIRLAEAARELRTIELEKLRKKYRSKFNSAEKKILTARQRVEREKGQYGQKKLNTVISIGSTLLGALLGSKSRGSATSAARGAGQAIRERGDIKRAEEKLKLAQEEFAELEAEFNRETQALTQDFNVENLDIETIEMPPRKSDIEVKDMKICWLPTTDDGRGALWL